MLAAMFPPAYMNAMLQGQALSGILGAATNVLILLLGSEPKDSAFFCFLITIIVMLVTACSLPLNIRFNKFFRHYDLCQNSVVIVSQEDEDALVADVNREDTYEDETWAM